MYRLCRYTQRLTSYISVQTVQVYTETEQLHIQTVQVNTETDQLHIYTHMHVVTATLLAQTDDQLLHVCIECCTVSTH